MTARRLVPVAAALVALLAAAALALVAEAGSRWDGIVRRGDIRFADASATASWHGPGDLRFRVARSILGLDDDLAFRRAVRLFAQTQVARRGSAREAALQSEAEEALAAVAREDGNRARASRAHNLLGVLAYQETIDNERNAATLLRRSLDELRAAIRLDPSNDDAKLNLELALRTQRARAQQQGSSKSQGEGGAGGGAGAGASTQHTGY